MSISSEISRISQNVSDSLDAVADKGVTVPAGANSDNLPSLIAAIPSQSSRVPVYGMGQNLIDNWYFLGGGTGHGVFPINQRNVTGNVAGYFIDRWSSSVYSGFSISLTANGMVLSNSGSTNVAIPQRLNNIKELLGKKVCYTILTTTGLYTNTGTLPSTLNNSGGQISVSDGTNTIGQLYVSSSYIQARLRSPARSGSITIIAVKLELGSEQTLAHQENGVWILNQIPDYETELIHCQTSKADSSDTYANKTIMVGEQGSYSTGVNIWSSGVSGVVQRIGNLIMVCFTGSAAADLTRNSILLRIYGYSVAKDQTALTVGFYDGTTPIAALAVAGTGDDAGNTLIYAGANISSGKIMSLTGMFFI